MSAPRSLFLVALPRSLSTVAHGLCCRSLGLRSPLWVDAGELLNGDRVLPFATALPHFLTVGDGAFTMLQELLDDAVRPCGRAYKDVVQPFAVARWLTGRNDRADPTGRSARSGLAVLHLRRAPADVAWSMIRRGWRYPERAGGPVATGEGPDDRLLRGLLRARRALDRLVATRTAADLDFDDLVTDESALTRALRTLYPETAVGAAPYLDDSFRRQRDEVLARRRRDDWRRLADRLEALTGEEPAP